MTGLLQDVRFALRTVRTTPGFFAAVATLALGIGGTTATFSVIDAVLLRPVAFRDSDRLVRLTADFRRFGSRDVGVSVPELADYRASRLFEAIAPLYRVNANLTGAARSERLEGLIVGGEYFTVLGVPAARGRLLTPADETPGIGGVAVITHGLWQRQLGGDERAIGRVIRLDGDPVEIVGVLPSGFRHPGRGIEGAPEFFQPSRFTGPPFREPSRTFKLLDSLLARLSPGVREAEAEQRLNDLGARLRGQYPDAYRFELDWQPRMIPLHLDVSDVVRPSLLALSAAVASVLLIACVNVANLLMARGSGRRREVAVRAALGATRARVARQLLTESLVLSAIGGTAGLLVAQWAISASTSLMPSDLPVTSTPALDVRVFAFAAAVSVLSGALFGCWPAVALSHASPVEALRGGGRSLLGSGGHQRVGRLLIAGEVALALVLLVGAGLLVRSFAHAWTVDPGFRPDQVLVARLWMPLPNDRSTGPYRLHATRVQFYRALLERLAQTRGVEQAGFVSRLPLVGQKSTEPFLIEGRPLETALQNAVEPAFASPGYFPAIGTRLVRGRLFTDDDTEDRLRVLVVSESFARRYFPGDDAIGKRIRPGGLTSTAAWYQIVGIVEDVRTAALDRDPDAQSYRCLWQTSDLAMGIVVRTAGHPIELEPALRAAVESLDPDLPVFGVRAMRDLVSASLASRRFGTAAVGAFAALALLLAAIGLHGVLSSLVRQRTGEIGLRVALGASPRRVLGLVLSETLVLVASGIALGLFGAIFAARALSGLLFGVPPIDPWTFATQALLLALVALAASYVPARRAMRVDPLVALRSE